MSTTTAPPLAATERAQYTFAYVRASDPLAQPLLADLEREYDARYGIEVFGEPASVEINRYPETVFTHPDGAFLVLLEDGEPVSGGAFFRHDERTAEVKRVWTRADRRGRGLARRVLTELEFEAKRLGYERIYLTTGPRQPEAVRLYLAHGYAPLYDTTLTPEQVGVHPFEKSLFDHEVQPRRAEINADDFESEPPAKSAAVGPHTETLLASSVATTRGSWHAAPFR